MKTLITHAFLFASCASMAVAATVTIEPIFTASGAALDSAPPNRFAVLTTPGDNSKVTHLISGSLRQRGDSASKWIGAMYVGIDSADASSETLERGIAAFELPSTPTLMQPDGSIATEMVAVIPRSGTWASLSTTPATSPLANASGTASASDLSINLTLNNPDFSCSIGYAVDEFAQIVLAPFSTKGTNANYDFDEGWLASNGEGSYVGVILESNPADFDSIAYVVKLTGMPDADNDGNPDLTDRTAPIWYAPHYVGDRGTIQSEWFGNFRMFGNEMIYHDALHWLYCDSIDDWLVAYDFNGIGWLATRNSAYPYMYLYDVASVDGQSRESGWAYLSVEGIGDGKVWLYFFEGSRTNSGADPNYPGWWNF